LCTASAESGVPVLVPNSRDCGSYFVCVGETAGKAITEENISEIMHVNDENSINLVPLQCAPSQHFLPEKNFCVPEDQSECIVN
jgi:hypothetical protein